MGKRCNTMIARSMGYLSTPSVEERTYDKSNIVVMGPCEGSIRSYHQGMSSKELWKAQRDHAIAVRNEFRL